MGIAEVLANIVLNLFSSQVYDVKLDFLEKISMLIFRKKYTKQLRKYIKNHDGTVLTTNDFEDFLTYHHLMENICLQVLNIDSGYTKEGFIRSQIELFHRVQKNPEKNRFDTDDILEGFIRFAYDKIDIFFKKSLSKKERYKIALVNSNINKLKGEWKSDFKIVQEELYDIKEILMRKEAIEDSEERWKIYQIFSAQILGGKITEVLQIYTLLSGKSKDLEYSITFLLNLMSDKVINDWDLEEITKNVTDERIYNDICRIAIYIIAWRENYKELQKISDRNTELNRIIHSIVENKHEDFYTIEKQKNGVGVTFNVKINNSFSKEEWLIKRICMLLMIKQPSLNLYEFLNYIIGNSNNILDKTLILAQKFLELYHKGQLTIDVAKGIHIQAKELVEMSKNYAIDIKCKIYEFFLISSILISVEEVESAFSIVPKELLEQKNIVLLFWDLKLRKGEVNGDELIHVCMRYGEYGLFYNYLIQRIQFDPIGTEGLIEKYKFTIDVDVNIFLVYVRLIYERGEGDKAKELLKKYQEKFGEFLKFWIDKLRIEYNEGEMMSLIEKFKNGEIIYLYQSGTSEFISLLMEYKKFEEVLDVIKICEVMGMSNPEYTRLKAIALYKMQNELEALALFVKIFEAGNQSDEILRSILILSYNNRRMVKDSVLYHAEKSENIEILTLTAGIYEENHEIEKACFLNRKVMLRLQDYNGFVFMQNIRLRQQKEHLGELTIESVNEDTVVYLMSEENMGLVYVIHSQHILPKDLYFWENSYHIYKETAIQLGLFRKKQEDIIRIDEKNFKIEKIVSSSAFFFWISMEKLAENGEGKKLVTKVDENGRFDIENFTKDLQEALGDNSHQHLWFDMYQDLSQLPVTFYVAKRLANSSYFQLISEICMDKSVIYREALNKMSLEDKDYIFSYSALVVLYRLGWKAPTNQYKYAVPKVLKNLIIHEIEEIIKENNREMVLRISVIDGKLNFIKRGEEDKNNYMKDAVDFRCYCEKFFAIDNENDISLGNDFKVDVKEVLGIIDYDSMSIAKYGQRLLVSGEVTVSVVSLIPEMDINSIGIADFLTIEASSADELLKYVSRMVSYKFMAPFTMNTVYRLIDFFEEGNEEERGKIFERWLGILREFSEDRIYKDIKGNYIRYCLTGLKSEDDLANPIIKSLVMCWDYISGGK